MAGEFLGIDHLGIAVSDLGAALEQWTDVLGFSRVGGEIMPERGLEVHFLDTGKERIELLGATSNDSEISKFLNKRGDGIHHICVAVADLPSAVDRIVEAGGRIVGDGIQQGAHNTRVAFVHPKSANGVLLELVEKKPSTDATT